MMTQKDQMVPSEIFILVSNMAKNGDAEAVIALAKDLINDVRQPIYKIKEGNRILQRNVSGNVLDALLMLNNGMVANVVLSEANKMGVNRNSRFLEEWMSTACTHENVDLLRELFEIQKKDGIDAWVFLFDEKDIFLSDKLDAFLDLMKEVIYYDRTNGMEIVQMLWTNAASRGVNINSWIDTLEIKFREGEDNGWSAAVTKAIRETNDVEWILNAINLGSMIVQKYGNKSALMSELREGQINREAYAINELSTELVNLANTKISGDDFKNIINTFKARELITIDFSQESYDGELAEWAEQLLFMILERVKIGDACRLQDKDVTNQLDALLIGMKRSVAPGVINKYWSSRLSSMNMSVQNKMLKWEMENHNMVKTVQKAL